MKFIITYKLTYANKGSTNKINIKNCRDKDHCEEKFFIWAKKKFKNTLAIEIESIFETPDDIVNTNANTIINAFNDIFGSDLNFNL